MMFIITVSVSFDNEIRNHNERNQKKCCSCKVCTLLKLMSAFDTFQVLFFSHSSLLIVDFFACRKQSVSIRDHIL